MRLHSRNISVISACLFANLMLVQIHAAVLGCEKFPEQGVTREAFLKIHNSYDNYRCFSEGLAVVSRDGKYGYVNKKGELVIPLQYSYAGNFKDGMAVASIKEKIKTGWWFSKTIERHGFINKQQQWVIPPNFDDAWSFSYGRARVGKRIENGTGKQSESTMRYGYIDKTGKQVIPFHYEKADSFQKTPLDSGASIIEAKVTRPQDSNLVYCLIDRNGKPTTPVCSEDNDFRFSAGLALVKINDKYGFINRKGTFVIAPKYDNAHPFNAKDQPASVRDAASGKWGFINQQGKVVLPFQYYHAYSFKDGKAYIADEIKNNQQQRFHIDLTGKVVADD